MLAAQTQTLNGMASSTPRRRGTDCKSSKKTLVQARLPFKRLNPEPKESPEHKRARPAPCPESSVSDGENEAEPSLLPVRHGPALVNGRGPLDGFMRRGRPGSTVVDLTGDDSKSPIKLPATPVSASSCLPAKDQHPSKDKPASTEKPSSKSHTPKRGASDCKVMHKPEQDEEVEEEADVEEETGSASLLDTTQGSESEEEEEEEEQDEESIKADVSSLGNTSMLSPSSVSSLSAAESSPEQAKTNSINSPTEPKTTPKIPADQKKAQRRSLKSPQEQEERNRQRQEREREREEAKAAKEKKKEEARKLKEEREKEKREKREKDEQEKREKKEKEEKEKAERLKAKEEQRKSKQEAKLEEKRKKEEEKRLKEEEKRLKEEKDRLKASNAAITRFLQKPKIQQAPKTLAAACGKFAPFELKDNMCLAPLCRVQCEDSVLEELDQYLLKPGEDLNGLKEWIRKKPGRSGPTKPRRRDYLSNCMVVEKEKETNSDGVPDRKHYGPMKLLKFRENHRPAYWGTWSKTSAHISPRCPLRQDKTLLDYEVDSDEEWEEEEPGESLSHSEGEDEEEGGANNGANDDDDDDGFFVPHGYLSDGEGALEEEEGAGDLEKQKVRQKLKAREWDELMSCKKKVKVLEAVVRGCVWEGQSNGPAVELFQPYAMCLIEPLPKADTTPSPEQAASKRQGDEQLVRQLLPLIHGNFNSTKVIITEFQEFCRQQSLSSSESSSSPPNISSPVSSADIPSRKDLKRLIQSNAVYEKRSTHRFRCWYVHAEVLIRFGQETLPVPCQWNYLTSGAREELREEPHAATGSHGNSPTTPQPSSTTPSSSKRKSAGSMSITKFMKKCTTDRKQPMETDGFQADTEDGDEDDCIVVTTQKGSCTGNTSSSTSTTVGEASDQMEVTASDNAALPLTSPAPTIATA